MLQISYSAGVCYMMQHLNVFLHKLGRRGGPGRSSAVKTKVQCATDDKIPVPIHLQPPFSAVQPSALHRLPTTAVGYPPSAKCRCPWAALEGCPSRELKTTEDMAREARPLGEPTCYSRMAGRHMSREMCSLPGPAQRSSAKGRCAGVDDPVCCRSGLAWSVGKCRVP